MMGARLSRWTPAYFAVAVLALLGAEALVAGGFAYPAAPLLAPWSLVAVHLVTIGWLSVLMLGALHQFLPVIAARPLASDCLAFVSLILITIGLAAMLLGFLALDGSAAAIVFLPLGGSAVLLGFLAAIANLGWTLRGAAALPLPARFVAAALVFLVLTALLGIGFGCAVAAASVPEWISLLFERGLRLHLLAGIGGWFALTAVGVSYKLLPMFMLADEERGRVGTGVLLLMAGGIAVAWTGGIVAVLSDSRWSPVISIGEDAAGAGAVLYLWDMVRLYRGRQRRALELNAVTAAVSLAFLGVAVGGLIVARVADGGEDWVPPLLLLMLLGWLSLLGLGQLYKIVPFLTWLERYAPRLGRGPVPRVQDLVNEKRARPWFAAFGLGSLIVAAAAMAASPTVARMGAAILFLSTLAIAWELITARRASPAPAAPAVSTSLQHRGFP